MAFLTQMVIISLDTIKQPIGHELEVLIYLLKRETMPTIDGYYLTRSPDSNRTDFVNYIKYDGWLLSRYIHAE